MRLLKARFVTGGGQGSGGLRLTIRLRTDREVRQSRTRLGDDPMEYLVRVIVDRLPDEIRIITAYRTSKIGKYWEQS